MSLVPLLRRARGAALLILAACGTAVGNPGNSSLSPVPVTDIRAVYAQALANAAIYEERHVLPLRPLQPDAEGRVAVVTLTDTAGVPADEEIWVSPDGEVRDSCLSWPDDADVPMRLRQLLGLRPEDVVSHFVVMRVPAAAVFRPTVDPSIHTTTPCAPEQARRPECGLHFPAAAGPAHVAWMANQMLSAWKKPDGYPGRAGDTDRLGYPWTRLGYTYNWHPGSPRYGASEYVIRPGADVTVTGTFTIAEYCAASGG